MIEGFIETRVDFENHYSYAPNVICYVKRLKGKGAFPKFYIPNYLIDREGFTLVHEKYDTNKFVIQYKVLEDEVVTKVKEEGFVI